MSEIMSLLRSQLYHQLQRLALKLTDPQQESEEAGSFHRREEPASSVGSQQREGPEEQKKDINADDTAPDKKPVTMDYYGQDISGHGAEFILRKLKRIFKKDYHGECAGFYNQGFPALSQHRHALWHSQVRQTEKPHENYWYEGTEENLMKEYINRHYDESALNVL